MAFPLNFIKSVGHLISEPFLRMHKWVFWKGRNVKYTKTSGHYPDRKERQRLLFHWKLETDLTAKCRWQNNVESDSYQNKECFPNIIHHNQSGYVKDRYIGETVRSIYDLMDFTDRENISGLLILIDFQKAFDTLEWDFLFKCLQCFNFGQDFIHWVKVFYQNIRSCVINNGTVSDYFNLERGIHSPHICSF